MTKSVLFILIAAACGRAPSSGAALAGADAASAKAPALSIVVLVEGSYLFMGNGSYVAEERADDAAAWGQASTIEQNDGAYAGLREALAVLGAGGTDRAIALVTIGRKVTVVRDFGPTLGADALPEQRSYRYDRQVFLVEGVRAAIQLLAARKGQRVLIYIGNGKDGESRDVREAVASELTVQGIELYVIASDPVNETDWWPQDLQQVEKLAGDRAHLRMTSRPSEIADAAGSINAAIEAR